MGRNVEEILAKLPQERRDKILARSEKLCEEIRLQMATYKQDTLSDKCSSLTKKSVQQTKH
jgi:hypothetical protein